MSEKIDVVELKNTFRKECRKLLVTLDPISKAFESCGKCVSFIQSRVFCESDIFFGFMPTKNEMDILPVLRNALEQGKKVLVPRVVPGSRDMDFFYIEKDLNRETELGTFGIYEPVKGLVKADLQEISEKYGNKICVLVPGLAFGKDHSRLGHGAGFYDKFLGNLKKMTGGRAVFVGVSYGALVFDSVPHESHDVSMDMLIGDFHAIL